MQREPSYLFMLDKNGNVRRQTRPGQTVCEYKHEQKPCSGLP